jgi:hypothetical protein
MPKVPEMRKYEVDLILRGYEPVDRYVLNTAGHEVQRAIGRHILLALKHGPIDIDIIIKRVKSELANKYRVWPLHIVIGSMTRRYLIGDTSYRLIRREDNIFIEEDWLVDNTKEVDPRSAYYLTARGEHWKRYHRKSVNTAPSHSDVVWGLVLPRCGWRIYRRAAYRARLLYRAALVLIHSAILSHSFAMSSIFRRLDRLRMLLASLRTSSALRRQ